MRYFFMFIFMLFIVGCSSNEVQNDQNFDEVAIEENDVTENQTIIVAFGDSLTEGLGVEREDAYPSQLEMRLAELGYEVRVFNSGYSGETTTGALNRVDWVLSLNPDVVILTTGANDAMRGIDLSITKSNIAKIIEKFQSNNVTVILSGMKIFENLGEEYITEFENIYPTLAEEYNVSFIPLFLEGVEANSSLNNDDQIHPNKEGYSIIVENNILPVLVPVLNTFE